MFPYTWLLKYLVDRVGGRSSAAPVSSAGVRPGVRPDVRPDVRAARVSSAAPKKKSFDRGGPVWPPRSNVTNDRLRGGLGGLCPPSQKPGGLGGSAPQPKPKIFRKNAKIYVYTFICLCKVADMLVLLLCIPEDMATAMLSCLLPSPRPKRWI